MRKNLKILTLNFIFGFMLVDFMKKQACIKKELTIVLKTLSILQKI